MNAYYNNERMICRGSGKIRRDSHRNESANPVAFLSYILRIFFDVISNENVLMTIRVTFSLGCLAALFVTVHALEIGSLSFFHAALIAIALLAAVALCFGKSKHEGD